MNDKRRKQIESHWNGTSPEKRPEVLNVFKKNAPKEEFEFLQALEAGKVKPEKEAGKRSPASDSSPPGS